MMPVRQPIRWVHRNPDDDVERVAQDLLRSARAETASDAPAPARERMWFRISSAVEPRPRRRWLVPAMATACVLAVATVVVLLARPAEVVEARVVVHAGSVRVEEEGRWQRALSHQGLALPGRVQVGAGARTSIALPRRTEVAVVGPAALTVGADAFVLESGETISTVEPGHGRFEVELGRYRVVVRGTQFWSAREGAEAAVCLVHGAVDVLAGDVRVARLEPGEGWRSSADAPAFPSDMQCGEATPQRSRDVGPVAVVERSAAPSPEPPEVVPVAPALAPASTDGSALALSPRSVDRLSASGTGLSRGPETVEPVLPPRTEPTEALGTVGARSTDEPGAVEPPSPPPQPMLPLPEAAPSQQVAPAPQRDDPAPQPRRTADRCREAPDRERCYRDAADGTDLTAQSALYRLGELRRDRGDRQGALDAWVEYRRRFGAGAFAEEADLAILEMRLRLGSPLARAAADRFLRLWPQSPYLAEVRGIRGLLRHRSGDCAGALDDYGEALGARVSGARRDEALYGRAACLDALGRATDARAAYERYLQDLPRGRFATQAREALGRTP